jgi:hypothetical protein
MRLKTIQIGLSYNSHLFFKYIVLLYYASMRSVVLTAAFQRIQVVCVDAVLLCEWLPVFRMWVLRSFETSGTTRQRTQPIISESLNPHFTASLQVDGS